jgi:transmembrane sensor
LLETTDIGHKSIYMKPYPNYTAEELALDDLFVQWVRRPDDEEVGLFWRGIIRKNPHFASTTETARQLVLTASQSAINSLTAAETNSLWRRIRTSLADVDEVNLLPPDARSVVSWWYFARTLAGIAGIVLLVGWAAWVQNDSPMKTIRTSLGQRRTVRLPDGSTVRLAGDSQLRFARQWDSECPRAVWLHGEGEFVVRPDSAGVAPEGTFRVHLPDLTVEVTGNQFIIQQRDPQTVVMLQSGRATLLLRKNTKPVLLQPGDSVTLCNGEVVPGGLLSARR